MELEPVTITEIKDEKKDIEFARENIYSTLTTPFEFPDDNVLVSLSGRIDKIIIVLFEITANRKLLEETKMGLMQIYSDKMEIIEK